MNDLEREIHEEAMEATARQTYRAIAKTGRPDIAVALILRAIDEWYFKGMSIGARLKDGEPCAHPGCLNHVTHPCEWCGRIAGVSNHRRKNDNQKG